MRIFVQYCGDCFPDFNFTVQLVSKRLGLWPSSYDLDGASNALLRLWKVYKLDLNKFIDGIVQTYTADQPMSDDEVLTVAKYADGVKDDYSEMRWLEASFVQEITNTRGVLLQPDHGDSCCAVTSSVFLQS